MRQKLNHNRERERLSGNAPQFIFKKHFPQYYSLYNSQIMMFRMNYNEVTENLQSEQSDIYRLNIVFVQRNNETEIICKNVF